MNSLFTAHFEIIDRNQIASHSNLIVACCQDCACAVSLLRPATLATSTRPLVSQVPHVCPPELRAEPLRDNYWSVFDPTGETGVVVLSESTYNLLGRFKQPVAPATVWRAYGARREEVEQAVGRLITLGLLQRPREARPPATPPPKLLTVWLHVTNQCNLSCKYCYLEKSDEHIGQAMGRAAVDAVLRSALAEGYPAVKLKYAGGEPSLVMDRVFTIHDYAVEQCQAHDIQLQAVILSNGTVLTTASIAGLKARGIKIMVSLDSLGQAHDTQRPHKNGSSSVQQVLAGIERLMEHGLPPHLSITISQHNCEHIDQVVRFALAHDLTFSLNLYRENNCSALFPELRYDEARVIASMFAAFQAIEANLPAWSVVGTVLDRGHLASPHQHPCGAARDYLVIDHRGRIVKCQMEMDEAVVDVEHPNPLQAIQHSPIGVQNLSALEKDGCRACEWRYWCTGGCPMVTYRVTGRYDVSSPNCNIYKAIYPQAVRLEGLRLLKYARETANP